jgi:hypothetical protein
MDYLNLIFGVGEET